MRDLGMSDDTISQIRLEALRLNDNSNTVITSVVPKFEARALPMDAISFEELDTFLKLPDGDYAVPTKFTEAVAYLVDRKIDPCSYPFYWTNKIGFNNRLIIPFIYKGEIVGWTARAINDAQPKYLSEQQPGFVFNLDNQTDNRQIVIVSEGPFDALSIDGCALLGAEIKDSQNWLLKQLGKEIVLVPDRDEAGKATLEQALEFGWSVSMPDWPAGIKDVNDAVCKIGRLATLYLITSAKESNSLKIQLRAKQWFKNEKVD